MKQWLQIFTVVVLFSPAVQAATVVTSDERITGTIVARDNDSLTVKRVDGRELKILRAKVLQVFDDKGELLWQATLPPEEKPKAQAPLGERKPAFAPKSIILDFYLGTAWGGFYDKENSFINDNFIISVQYADGSTQNAKTNMFLLGGGISYQDYDSARWSNLFSYVFRSTAQTISTGDGNKYEKKTLADKTITSLHAVFAGKEIHFYPSEDYSSFDFIGQVGYQAGAYYPLANYETLRTGLPWSQGTPMQYTGLQNTFVHGPTARLGAGFTFRGTNWQFRLLGFYQVNYLLASESANFTSLFSTEKGNFTQDLYAGISLGYGW